MTANLTVFIIAKNEENNIRKCILSVKELTSEVIVVDSESSDRTVQIAKEAGAEVYIRPFDHFSGQKSFAFGKVRTPWALNLDADETLTPQLCEEIRRVLPNTPYAGFLLHRQNYFLGKHMKHSGLDKEYILRLVRTDTARYDDKLVHEGLHVKGPVGRLNSPFLHHSYNSIEGYFAKFNEYTTLSARQMYANGRHFHVLAVLARLPLEFFRRYILKLGLLDGMRGFLWATFSAYSVLVKYMKLWALQQQNK